MAPDTRPLLTRHAPLAGQDFSGQDLPWLLDYWAGRQPDKPVLIWEPRHGPGSRWTYAEFWQDIQALAAGLLGRGVGQGDKILIHADNCPEMVLGWYACAAVGAVAVTTNTRSVAAELENFIEKTGCLGAITQPAYAQAVRAAGPALRWLVVTADDSGEPPKPEGERTGLPADAEPFDTLYGDPTAFRRRSPDPMAPVGIMFTSGTTSRPKAVVHTHANALWAARTGPANVAMHPEGTYLIYLPFFHVNAQSWSLWTTLGVGGTVVLQPKFSSSRFWEVVTTHRVTHISLIPFVMKALAGQAIPESSLEVGVFGLIVPQLEAWLGITVVPAWGMTETVIHATSRTPWHDPPGSMGRPAPGYQLIVVDQETGRPAAAGQPGELWVRGIRGVQLFAEYYDDPEANAKSFTDDGWFKTGDIVRIGEGGSFFFCERDKDLLKVGGENVSAREVEDVIRQVEGIAEVAVVGRSHEMLDVVPVAFVIVHDSAGVDRGKLEAKVISLCQEQLADFKVPRAVHVVDEFPRATLDKVVKSKLRELADDLAESS